MKLIVLLAFQLALATATEPQLNLAPRPFVSDRCTGFWEGTPRHPGRWAHCCAAHDLFFWAGGTEGARNQADSDLRSCVRATGHRWIAELVYRSVRLGKYSPMKIRGKQWGNAWSDKISYRYLSGNEILAIEAATKNLDVPGDLREKLIHSLWEKSFSGEP